MGNLPLVAFLCASTLSPALAEKNLPHIDAFTEWQESIQRSAAGDHSIQGEEWRKAEEQQMADRLLGHLNTADFSKSRDGYYRVREHFRNLFLRVNIDRLNNELVVKFMRKPWYGGDKAPLEEPYSGPGSTVDFDADSAWHCARIMQPYLPKEKLFPFSKEAPSDRFRFHRWRYDMAEKFRAALAAKSQIVDPPDPADLPKETASGEEIWAHSPYNPRSGTPPISSVPDPTPAPAPPAVSAPRSWTLPLAGLGVLAAGLLAWFRLRR